MKTDYLIVGAGLSGCILAERISSKLNKKVILIDKRNHIAGNIYDYYNDDGILVHKYGPHLFHSKVKRVWNYLSQFTEWLPYQHHVLAVIENRVVPIPFNFNTLEALFSKEFADKLEKTLIDEYGNGNNIPILKLMENQNKDLKFLADFIYKNVFLGYNLKQWGLRPEELDFSVSARVPVRLNRDNRYFLDNYQGVPKHGYTKMVEKIISNKAIEVLLNLDYKQMSNKIEYDKLIYTGPIDEYFDYKFGKLPYRSLRFDFKTIEKEYFQAGSQVNYPNDNDYTRITEFKHITSQIHKKTTIAYEYSLEYDKDLNEPYYPIPNEDNHKLFNKYKEESKNIKDTYFLGRLADYKYYNMDQIVAIALQLFDREIRIGN